MSYFIPILLGFQSTAEALLAGFNTLPEGTANEKIAPLFFGLNPDIAIRLVTQSSTSMKTLVPFLERKETPSSIES